MFSSLFGSNNDQQGSAEYNRGVVEATQHRSRTEESWVRATLGPFVWLGIPLGLSLLYMRRTGGAAASKAGGGGGGMMGLDNMMEMMNPIKSRQFKVDIKGTKFADVIGVPEAKEEVRQYVSFLQSPNKFTRLGARLPKGCLLTGEPGTGKTLLAKAVAGEADVSFFSCSGADFVEIMGGSGPKRVRELFDEARKESPCIVFIDEIDAIGSRGGQNKTSVSSEENRTINALLAELDGLTTSSDAIIVMAATNFEDNIDKALLREGRFDRKIPIEMPDLRARREVLEYYLGRIITGDPSGMLKTSSGEEVAARTNVSNAKLAYQLADLTPGMSPAALSTVVNEAALAAGIADKKVVDTQDLLEAVDNTLLGKKQRSRATIKSTQRTALHEAGHAFVAWNYPQQKKVLKVSILPRGNALGYTQRSGGEFHEYQTNATMFTDLVMMLGGRAAEDVMLAGDISSGAMDDLQRATDMALKEMLAFGMGHDQGLLSFHPESVSAGRNFVRFSEATQRQAEAEASVLVDAAYTAAKQLIEQNKDKLRALADELVEKKEMLYDDVAKVWGERPTKPTHREISEELETVILSQRSEQRRQHQIAAGASA